MDNNQVKVTAAELKDALLADVDRLAEETAAAMNNAAAGRIIADSEELVRDAHGRFRQAVYQKALGLLQAKREAFSPSARRIPPQGGQVGDAPDGQRGGDD